MPNIVEQDLHIVGPTAELDRFVRTGFRRKHGFLRQHLLLFTRLCPLKRGEPDDTYTEDSGFVLTHVRTRTQAYFGMITNCDYPAEFYRRLPLHWPALSFICSVNEDMGQFGGVVLGLNGRTQDAVYDYDIGYSRRSHAREVRSMVKRWAAVLTAGRDWQLQATAIKWFQSLPFDARFDDDFWMFFRSREELMRFRARYRTRSAMRRVNGEWRRIRPGGSLTARLRRE